MVTADRRDWGKWGASARAASRNSRGLGGACAQRVVRASRASAHERGSPGWRSPRLPVYRRALAGFRRRHRSMVQSPRCGDLVTVGWRGHAGRPPLSGRVRTPQFRGAPTPFGTKSTGKAHAAHRSLARSGPLRQYRGTVPSAHCLPPEDYRPANSDMRAARHVGRKTKVDARRLFMSSP